MFVYLYGNQITNIMKKYFYVARQLENDALQFSLTVYEIENNEPVLVHSDYINRGDEGLNSFVKREIESKFGECIIIQLQ